MAQSLRGTGLLGLYSGFVLEAQSTLCLVVALLGTWGRERPVSASAGPLRLQSPGPPAPHQAQLFRLCGFFRNREFFVILPNKEISL